MCHFRAVALQQCHHRAWLYILGRQGRHCCRLRSPRVLAEARQVPPRAEVRMFSAALIAVRIGLGLTTRAPAPRPGGRCLEPRRYAGPTKPM